MVNYAYESLTGDGMSDTIKIMFLVQAAERADIR